MLVKCTDGLYYRNPEWRFDNRYVKGNDEIGLVLIAKSKWETARANIGLPIRRADKSQETVPGIFKGRLVTATQYPIALTGDPPPPTGHEGFTPDVGGEAVCGP